MKISGETMLFKNDFGYSTTVSNKKQDGTYENMSIVVQFRKDDAEAQKIPTKTKINIKNGFLAFYYSTSGEKKLKLVVLDYEVLGMTQENAEPAFDEPTPNEIPDNASLYDDDLPF